MVYQSATDIVNQVIEKTGETIVIATPLGVGKPNQLLNAFYQRAKQHSDISLTIITALSLVKPKIKNELASRLFKPILQKLYSDHIELDYEIDRRNNKLADNVKIMEFYLSPGAYLQNDQVQKDYIYCNYTHAVRDLLNYNINVVAQLVTYEQTLDKLSFSCNCDLTNDLLKTINNNSSTQEVLLIGEINQNLPFMYGDDAIISSDQFFAILENDKKTNQLFVIPRPEISEADYMIGLYQSMLIKDDGCLQIGIGGMSDALVQALILRHKKNKHYKKIIKNLNSYTQNTTFNHLIELDEFNKGIFAATEMLVDGYMDLYENNILKKHVYDDKFLQQALNNNLINEKINSNILDLLIERKVISTNISSEDFNYLQHFGIFKSNLKFDEQSNKIILADGKNIKTDLKSEKIKYFIIEHCLGEHLKNGSIAHAGFFLGSQKLFKQLKMLSDTERKKFNMRSIMKINQLYHSEEIDRLQRINARFTNSCIKISLLGAAISDGLDNGKMVSGVGGQYNFVAMAHELENARSIISCRSTYIKNKKIISNIVYNDGHTTIPRHLRDIFVTEYGIADCRSKSDEDVIKALLNITDSRFQKKLLKKAKTFGKLAYDYQIPKVYCNNYPKTITQFLLKYKDLVNYQAYPFNTELTSDEIKLKQLLKFLKHQSFLKIILLIMIGLFKPNDEELVSLLKRMRLDKKQSLKDFLYQWLLVGAYRINQKG